ncbi:MAG: PD-(D/E)XK nuclease family transposase [Erysipelotrichales bacterium]|nr:PD-(D/E)XK nuclease family transposase [Erysipelotrichales bacterium]
MTTKEREQNVFERKMLEKAPLRDYGFHKIFDPTTNDGRECIRFLLRSICGMNEKEIEVLLPKRYESEKGEKKNSESDIRIIVDKKYRVIIEMQLVVTKEFLLRSGFYAASEVANQLDGSDKHIELMQTVIICIMDEVRIDDKDEVNYLKSYRMRNEEGEERIGFPYVYDVYLGNLVNKEIDFESYDIETILAVFARVMYNKDDERFKDKVKQYIINGEGILMSGLDRITDKIEHLCSNEEEKERLIKEYWDYQTQKGIERELKNEGREEGRKEGIEEGIEKALHENIVRMHSKGKSVEEIVDLLGTTVEKVNDVLRSVK